MQPTKEDSSSLVRHLLFSHIYIETVLIKIVLPKLFVKHITGASRIVI